MRSGNEIVGEWREAIVNSEYFLTYIIIIICFLFSFS